MKKNTLLLTVIALSLVAAPAWSAKNKSIEQIIEEGKKAADNVPAELAREEEARKQAMADYWDAWPEAEPVVPGQLLSKLKKTPWPDPRPVPKEKYLERPVVKARELTEAEGDPLLAGLGKKEAEVKNELEAAQQESDEARYALWLENFGFFQRGINACEGGRTAGADRVKILEAALVFLKEGEPRFYLRETTEKAAGALDGLAARVKQLIPNLYAKGEYVPDYRAMLWAEQTGGQLAGGLSDIGETEKRRFYKIIKRIRDFDPRAPKAEAAGGSALTGAPAAGAAKNAKWEQFLRGLTAQCRKIISTINFAAAPEQQKAIGDKIEQDMRKMLASFPAGWEKYPRAKWAHRWFSGALERGAKASDPQVHGLEIYTALDKYEAGLGPERE